MNASPAANGSETGKTKAERDADLKAKRRQEQAGIVSGLQTVLEGDEQLLGFTRGRIAGGIKGKLSVGPEAFFAPYVNIGLTDRRVVLQHIHHIDGRPSEIMPHYFDLGDVAALQFDDIETFGGEPAGRLVLRQTNAQSFRLRLSGQTNFESAQAMSEVFRSLTAARKQADSPTHHPCACGQKTLDQPFKFCPFCGLTQQNAVATEAATASDQSANVAADAGLYPIEVPIPVSNNTLYPDSPPEAATVTNTNENAAPAVSVDNANGSVDDARTSVDDGASTLQPPPAPAPTSPSDAGTGGPNDPQEFPEFPIGDTPHTSGPTFTESEKAATSGSPDAGESDEGQEFPELPIGDNRGGEHHAPNAPDAPHVQGGE